MVSSSKQGAPGHGSQEASGDSDETREWTARHRPKKPQKSTKPRGAGKDTEPEESGWDSVEDKTKAEKEATQQVQTSLTQGRPAQKHVW